MPRKQQRTEIYSIFGQIEAAAAQHMIEKGLITYIPPDQIPPTAAVNEAGAVAQFAVVVPATQVARFNELIANLRA